MIPRPPPGGAATAPQDDPSIPVLTEHLEFPPLELDTTLPSLAPSDDPFAALPSLVPPDDPFLRAPVPPSMPGRREPVLHWPDTPAPAAARPEPEPEPEPELEWEAAPAEAAPPPKPAGPAPAALLDDAAWAQIEHTLRDTILQEVAQRLPHEIETTVRSRAQAAIDRALESLVAEAQLAIATTLRDVIERAVRASLELERETLRRAGRSH